jgi:hypothetical protein
VIVGIGGKVIFLRDLRQNFVEQEARVAVAHSVVLIASVGAIRLARCERLQDARVNEDPDGHRHVVLGDQIVKHNGNA